MPSAHRVLVAGGLGLAASLLTACGGGSGLLSGGQANNLNNQLDQVSRAVSAGNCAAARDASSAFSSAITNLPGSVNQGLVSNLEQGAQTVSTLAAVDCSSTSTSTSSSSTTTTSSSTTTTTSTSSTPTSTSSTITTTSSTPTSTATSSSATGTSSSTSGSGGAGLGNGTGGSGTGGAGAGNGGGNGQ